MHRPLPWNPAKIRLESWLFALAVGVGLLARWAWGFRSGVVNNEFHFPILLSMRQGIPFTGDALVGTLGNFASPLWFFLARLPSSMSIDSILDSAFVVSRILLAWGAGWMVGALVRDEWRTTGRVVGTVATLSSGWVLNLAAGADPVMGTYFSQTFLSVALLVGALGFGFSRHHWTAAVFLGLAYDVNLMQANFAAGILSVVWIASAGPGRRGLLQLAGRYAVVGLVGAPGFLAVLHVLGQHPAAGAMVGKSLADFAAFHIPGHFFWAMKSSQAQVSALALFVLPVVAVVARGPGRRVELLAGLVPLGYFGLQLVLQAIAPSRFLFQLHLFRSDVFSFAMAAGFCLAGVVESLGEHRRRDATLWTGATLLVLTGNFAPAAGLLLAGIAMDRWPERRWIAFALVGSTGILLWWSDASRTTFFLAAIAFAGIAGILVPSFRPRSRVVLAGVHVVLLVASSARTCQADVRPAIRGNADRMRIAYESALAKGRDASPPGALFAVVPSRNSRPVLQRGVYLTIWDGAGFLWNAGHENEVVRRLGVSGVRYTPGIQYVVDSIDRQWAAGLCDHAANLAAEGVAWVVAPVSRGRVDPASERFDAFPMDSLLHGGICPGAPSREVARAP